MQLQIVFVDRPADDPLLMQTLWRQVDQVGASTPETRAMLSRNGFRLGLAGGQPPPALQTLLGLTTEIASKPGVDDPRMMHGRQLALTPGQDAEVLLHQDLTDFPIRYRLANQEDEVSYLQARCLFRIKPVRLNEGWVRVEFTPEVQHGQHQLRRAATDDGWALRGGQLTDSRQSLGFSVTLNTGEFAAIGCDGQTGDTPGRAFFSATKDGRAIQRLLVVRLADAGADSQSP